MFIQLVFRHLNEQNEALFMTLSGPMSNFRTFLGLKNTDINFRTFQYSWETCIYIDSHL